MMYIRNFLASHTNKFTSSYALFDNHRYRHVMKGRFLPRQSIVRHDQETKFFEFLVTARQIVGIKTSLLNDTSNVPIVKLLTI